MSAFVFPLKHFFASIQRLPQSFSKYRITQLLQRPVQRLSALKNEISSYKILFFGHNYGAAIFVVANLQLCIIYIGARSDDSREDRTYDSSQF